MTRFPYPIGWRVAGDGFRGVVTEHRSAYDVVLDDALVVPVSLIRSAEAPLAEPVAAAEPDLEQTPAVGQLTLF